jgi:hypothetical protein
MPGRNGFALAVLHLFIFMVVCIMPGAARASAINQCIDACFSGFSCTSQGESYQGICQGNRDRCVAQCNQNINGREDQPPVRGAYGAIAYDEKTGAWGLADASQSKSDAKKSALAYCGKHGSDCEIVESFSNQCAAMAAGTGNRFGWAVDSDARQAGLDAIAKCGKSGPSGNPNDHSSCFMQLYHCYSD